MCDLNGKRCASGLFSSCSKRVKESFEKDGPNISPITTASASSSFPLSAPSVCNENERLQPVASIDDNEFSPVTTPLEYGDGLPLQPEELLLYSLIKICAPGNNINSVKGFSPEKFQGVSNAIWNVYQVHFNCVKLRNYFYRSINNARKGLGKFKGILRWRYFNHDVDTIVVKYHQVLVNLLINNYSVSAQDYNDLKDALNSATVSNAKELNKSSSLAYKVTTKPSRLQEFRRWKVMANTEDLEVRMLYLGESLVKVEYEVIIYADGTYKFIIGGKPKVTNLKSKDKNIVSNHIYSLSDLYSLMEHLQSCYICPGVSIDEYKDVVQGITESEIAIYRTASGEPAAFVEPLPSNFKLKVIRSTKCSLIVDNNTKCEACLQTSHYMRTIKSRKSKISAESTSKYSRFDYMTKEALITTSRNMAEKIHKLETRVKRLKEHQENMDTVGKATDSDFRSLFQQLYSGLNKVMEKHSDNNCYWKDCNDENEYKSNDALLKHIRACHIKAIVDAAPIDREYICNWLSCTKTFPKKHLENHFVEHIGCESDLFFISLLKDQAKALNTPSRQMRWHPSVLKWCLRLYTRSHSLYADLRDAGFLKLPSGRTLSDYKNYCSSKSGWQLSVLGAMRDAFRSRENGSAGTLGGLFFDEVKIKEGLLFDPSSWELIGFVDLEDETAKNNGTVCIQDKLATHVLQFYYKSLFSSFTYPCGYFLTRGISASTLNKVFWQGVAFLHSHGFTVLVTCCDGAAENRAFMVMNGCSEDNSITQNPFSKQPLIFLSDPPHLLKELRNNVYNSGYKEESARHLNVLKSLIFNNQAIDH